MNNKANYTLVGLMVLLGVLLMIVFGYWLLKPSNEADVKKYNIYFKESVLGLNIDAAVKYKGVSVGKVLRMGINPKNQEEVEVLVEILSSTPITTSTLATLTSQGITGLSYINLSHAKDVTTKVLEAQQDQKYPVIKSSPSLFVKAENVLENMFVNIDSTLQKISLMLDEKNQKNIAMILQNSASITSKIDNAIDINSTNSIKYSIKNIESLTHKLDDLVPKVQRLMDNSIAWEDKINASLASIASSYIGIQASMGAFKSAIENGEFNIKEISSDTIPALNATLEDMQTLIQKTTEILNQYEKSPADMFFMQEKIKKAPGEK